MWPGSASQVTKAEMPTTAELTASMGGLVVLRLLSVKNDTALNGLVTRAVSAELVARGIILTEEEASTLKLRAKCTRYGTMNTSS